MYQKPLVALVMPHRNGQGNIGAGEAYATAFKDVDFIRINRGHSLLTFTFNQLLAEVLNLRRQMPITHLAMIHNDVVPLSEHWGNVFLSELEATGADMISATVPIKDDRGLTSTAVEDYYDEWMCRRLTMHEVHQLPATFGAEDVAWHGPEYGRILLNTGLWLCKLGTWIDMPGPITKHRFWFRQQDRIMEVNGELVATSIPEDWDMSRQLQDLGLKLLATRKVALYHEKQEYTNARPWGRWQTDLGYLQWKKLERERYGHHEG